MVPNPCRILRNAVIGALATALDLPAMPQAARALTPEQCELVVQTALLAFEIVGPKNLSAGFRKSFVNFVGPERRCDGPPEIKRVTKMDKDTYEVIREELASPKLGPPKTAIDLDAELAKLAAARGNTLEGMRAAPHKR
jgi:hypothetical protein